MKQPNILIVMTDHQRADTVRPEHPAPTPHAVKLAQEGITFGQTYCPSPTSPRRFASSPVPRQSPRRGEA